MLAEKYEGYFHNFITPARRSCTTAATEWSSGWCREFPRFNDVSQYDGHEIKFYKLPQLGYLGRLFGAAPARNNCQLDDIGEMTAFADYIVPVALRLMGMTSYSTALEHAINTYQLIPRDSTQEIEIRAHCLYATALLREEINKIRPPDMQIIIPQIDARLWTHYHTTFWPHHLTRTIMY